MKLKGRNAIVTGGSQGLGRAIVEAFLREGANVAFCSRTLPDVTKTLDELRPRLTAGQKLSGVAADVCDPGDVDRLFDTAAEFGPLHILVNNAGVYGPIGPIEELDLAEWKRAFDINLFGAAMCAQRAIRLMKPRGYGKIDRKSVV